MTRIIALALAAAILVLAYQTVYAEKKEAGDAGKESMNKQEVQAIIKDYLLTNPEVVVESLEAYQKKEQLKLSQQAEKAIGNNRAALFDNPAIPSVGPADADIVIAEFFDYHCGYCKHMLPVITQLLKEDNNVRIVFHELPILSKSSRLAAKAALAVYQLKPDQYFAYHSKLMTSSEDYTEANLTQLAVSLGVDKADFTRLVQDEKIENALNESSTLAKSLGVNGTPAFVVEDELLPGAVSIEQLKQVIAAKRNP